MHRGPRNKNKNTNVLSASVVLPTCGSMRTVKKLARLKYLTDVLVSWLREHGYSELTVEIFGAAVGPPAEYRVTLKSDLD